MSNGRTKEMFAPVALHDFATHNGLGRDAHLVMPEGPSMTRQEFAEECDINSIMDRYDAYLSDPMRSIREPVYYNFTEMPDTLMGAMEVLHAGESAFMSLPAAVRREFDNNAAAFVDFASDPGNVDQMREWGLCAPEEVPASPMKVEIVQGQAKPGPAPESPQAPAGSAPAGESPPAPAPAGSSPASGKRGPHTRST